jgi:hypothetical protein
MPRIGGHADRPAVNPQQGRKFSLCTFGFITEILDPLPSVDFAVQLSTSAQSGTSRPDSRASVCGGDSGSAVMTNASGGSRKVERMPATASASTCRSECDPPLRAAQSVDLAARNIEREHRDLPRKIGGEDDVAAVRAPVAKIWPCVEIGGQPRSAPVATRSASMSVERRSSAIA